MRVGYVECDDAERIGEMVESVRGGQGVCAGERVPAVADAVGAGEKQCGGKQFVLVKRLADGVIDHRAGSGCVHGGGDSKRGAQLRKAASEAGE